MSFHDIPRVNLIHGPTPLEPLARLRTEIRGPRIWLKRDDCTGLGGGGNKSRKLEYLIAAAEAEGADCVVTYGALQSNHARQTAAAAARRGLGCDLVLQASVPREIDDYPRAGNLLLDDLFGARIHRIAAGEDRRAHGREVIAAHAAAGRRCAEVPVGGSSAIGALGYVRCAAEIAEACTLRGIFPAAVLHSTSSGGTQAGLVAGFASESVAPALPLRVVGINTYRDDGAAIAEHVRTLAEETLARIEPGSTLPADAVEVVDGHVGAGYGRPTRAMTDAVRLLARTEGVLLDPVYSGKAFAGLLALVAEGRFDDDDDVIFIHTGGAPALGVYTSAFEGTDADVGSGSDQENPA